jgi:hypothetical protein
MKTLLSILGLLTLGVTTQAAEPANGSACTIVAGGGRNALSNDTQVNDRWNRLNFSFFDAAAEAIRASSPVEQAFFAVGSTDAAKNAEVMMAQAAKSGCTRIAFFSVFSDQGKLGAELVFSLRVSSIRRAAGGSSASAPAARPSIGAVEYEKEYRFAATPASFDKVVPSRIADEAVRDYRASR